MHKNKFAVVSDIIFSFFCFFILFFVILNYFMPRLYAIILALWLSGGFTSLIGANLVKKYNKACLNRAEKLEYESTVTALNFMPSVKTNALFCKAITGEEGLQKSSGGIEGKNNKIYFIKFSFDGVNKTDLVRYFNKLNRSQTGVICSEEFSEEVKNFALRFGGRLILMDGKECYALLKEKGCLPKSVTCMDKPKPKANPKNNFLQRKNAKKFFLFGVTFCVMSFFVSLPVYYIVCGSVMLALSLITKLFGFDDKAY